MRLLPDVTRITRRRRRADRPVLTVTGTLHDENGVETDALLWRVAFRGWGAEHRLMARAWCEPEWCTVSEDGVVRAAGYAEATTLMPGGELALRVAGRGGRVVCSASPAPPRGPGA